MVGRRIKRLVRVGDDERPVESRGQLTVVVQVRVIDERAGARRREANDEGPPGSIIGVTRRSMPLKPWTPS